jgi:hypothetical protein
MTTMARSLTPFFSAVADFRSIDLPGLLQALEQEGHHVHLHGRDQLVLDIHREPAARFQGLGLHGFDHFVVPEKLGRVVYLNLNLSLGVFLNQVGPLYILSGEEMVFR